MKITLNTIDGKEVTITERIEKGGMGKSKLFIQDRTYAVIQTSQSKLELDPGELVRAINAMWGGNREYEIEM